MRIKKFLRAVKNSARHNQRRFIARLRRRQRIKNDIEIINRRADYLNEEVMDALNYQCLPSE